MTYITVTVSGVRARCEKHGILTAGMVGVPCEFLLDSGWEGLVLTAVFQGSGVKKDVFLEDKRRIPIPHEVLAQPGELRVGLEGRFTDGTVLIPTTWTEEITVLPGALATGDPALAPSRTQYDYLMDLLRTEGGKKVDKVPGKALSTNDFTDFYRDKLDNLETAFTPDMAAAEGQPGHILNRTHYFDQSQANVLLALSGEFPQDNSQGSIIEIPTAPALEAGKTYTILYNGKTYQYPAQADQLAEGDDVEPLIFIGNRLMLGELTGEPFSLLILPNQGFGVFIDLTSAQTYELVILADDSGIHKLDNLYLDMEWTPSCRDEIREVFALSTSWDINERYKYVDSDLVLEPDKGYLVRWGDTEAVCRCISYTGSSSGLTVVGIGNFSEIASQFPDNYLPFVIYQYYKEGKRLYGDQLILFKPQFGAEEMDVQIMTTVPVPVPMPESFMPESLEHITLRSPGGKYFVVGITDEGTLSLAQR